MSLRESQASRGTNPPRQSEACTGRPALAPVGRTLFPATPSPPRERGATFPAGTGLPTLSSGGDQGEADLSRPTRSKSAKGLTLKSLLHKRPVIYEIVPPRRDASRFNTELRGVEGVFDDSRIAAINVPELINRRSESGKVLYSPATIPPEEYALMIMEYKEPMVNVIAPRLTKEEFLGRTSRIMNDYHIPNLVVVGKESQDDFLPGPSVIDGLRLLDPLRGPDVALGGICIFDRESKEIHDYGEGVGKLEEHERVWSKGRSGCDFVTSQVAFSSEPAVRFLSRYQEFCGQKKAKPLTVFISLATVPTPSILSLLESLDVQIPSQTKKDLLSSGNMARESVKVATEVFMEIITKVDLLGIDVPLGLQIEQIGVNNDRLSLELLDAVYPQYSA